MFNPNLNFILLASTKDLKEIGFLAEELDENLIPNAIKYIQDGKIQNILGTPLFQILLSEVEKKYDSEYITGGTVYVIPEKYSILIDNYILSAIGYFVQAELMLPMTNKLRNKGILNTSDDKVTPIDYATIKSSVNYYNDRGEFYLDLLSRYIKQNTDKYPEYLNWFSFDKISNDNAFKSPIYFGKKRRPYTDKFDKYIK